MESLMNTTTSSTLFGISHGLGDTSAHIITEGLGVKLQKINGKRIFIKQSSK
jgi:hypothetical protein